MQVPLEDQAIRQATQKLSEILAEPVGTSSADYEVSREAGLAPMDAVVTVGPHSFALEWKRSGSLGQVALAGETLKRVTDDSACSWIPVIAVPYMGQAGRSYCEQLGMSWLDLSGNAKISAPGLFVHVMGHANRFRRPGRPESAFGPKGSRIARWLLMHPGQTFRQRALASATGLNEGYTSRVIRKLTESGLVSRDRDGLRVDNADRLLDAWHEAYSFDKHTVLSGHIASVSGDDLARDAAQIFDRQNIRYALTGLAAAWSYTHFASFRLLTVYLPEFPSPEVRTALGFRSESRGANTWLVVPKDEGVFHGARLVDGIRCVHPVQAYLDLKGHPERALEAGEELRVRRIAFKNDAR